MSRLHPDTFLSLGIFRLQDVCVRVQEEMEDFLETAALEKVAGIEATFRWLRKRSVRIALLSDLDRDKTQLLLRRLGWAVGEDQLIQLVLTNQEEQETPVAKVLELAGHRDGTLAFTCFDTPRLLLESAHRGIRLSIGMTNGQSSYGVLSALPTHVLLDHPIQLPNCLLERLPELRLVPPVVVRRPATPPHFRWSGFVW